MSTSSGDPTTLYRPVLIESAEQAEALPIGVFAIKWETPWIGEHRGPDDDGRTWWESKNGLYTHSEIVGDTALVPIEAEEETTHEMRTSRGVENLAPSYGIFPVPSRRLVTPWEEA